MATGRYHTRVVGGCFVGPLTLIVESALLFAKVVSAADAYALGVRTGRRTAMEGYVRGWASAADELPDWKDTQDYVNGRSDWAAEANGAKVTALQSWRRVKESSDRASRVYFQWKTGGRLASAASKRGYAEAFRAGRVAGQNGGKKPRALC